MFFEELSITEQTTVYSTKMTQSSQCSREKHSVTRFCIFGIGPTGNRWWQQRTHEIVGTKTYNIGTVYFRSTTYVLCTAEREDAQYVINTRWYYLFRLAFTYKPIRHTTNVEQRTFRANQEAAHKDVEWLFGIVKVRIQIIRRKILSSKLDDIKAIENTCVIFHNLIVHMKENVNFWDAAGGENLIT